MGYTITRVPPDDTAPRSTGQFVFLVATCILIMVLEGIDIQALGVAAPVLMPALGIDAAQSGIIFGIAQVGGVFGAVLGGRLSDIWGRRNALLLSTLLFGAGTLATIVAFDFNSLLVIRTLTGFGIGAALPNVIGLAAEAAPARHRIKTVTVVLAGMPLGGAVVSLFAAVMMQRLGWQSLFVLGGALPLALMFLLMLVPNHRPVRPAEAAERGSVVRLLSERRRATLLLWVVFFLTSGVLYMMLNWLPSLMHARGFTVVDGQMAALYFNIASVLGPVTMGWLIDRHGYRFILPLCYGGLLAGILGMALTATLPTLLASVTVVGFFLMGAQFSLNGVTSMLYPPEIRGFGVGAALAVGRVGSIIGPFAAGVILQGGGGTAGVLAAIIPFVAIGAVTMALLGRSEARAPAQSA
ncbi:MFS transporter [Paracoccus versutus]|uniref:AAHS family 3-hydroxyphenylpropionic acid transporter n=1 Tax=Paracoccus versutus TaxID=34007 RepID=A0AAQ0KLD5_PARVE|nr:MFS transporter [Paracoccus versutus]KGJ08607.1 3-phenylpropionic acid transporter [Paracoccus versutus]REG45928.1 AAHS family 3-hydroxyphenylpropionic acid transporter [Paracoccus versutus]WEJ77629.1 MFS transporter [Paracoccus versutus]